MLSFIIRRLIGGVVLLFVASSLTFLLMNANSSGIAIRHHCSALKSRWSSPATRSCAS